MHSFNYLPTNFKKLATYPELYKANKIMSLKPKHYERYLAQAAPVMSTSRTQLASRVMANPVIYSTFHATKKGSGTHSLMAGKVMNL
jgi:hypothetical protein